MKESKTAQRSKIVAMRMTAEEKAHIEREAARKGVTITQLLRRCINHLLRRGR